jgi:hypothetical protein
MKHSLGASLLQIIDALLPVLRTAAEYGKAMAIMLNAGLYQR